MVKKKCNTFKDQDSSTESNDDLMGRGSAGPIQAGSGESCKHALKAVEMSAIRKRLKTSGLDRECAKCAEETKGEKPLVSLLDDDENGFAYDTALWMCLKCGTQLCGRSQMKHAKAHYETPRSDQHSLCINTTNFEIWCYQCDDRVKPNSLPRLQECVEFVKKTANKSKELDYQDQPFGPLNVGDNELIAVMGDVLPIQNSVSGPTPAVNSSAVTNSTMGTTPQYRAIRPELAGVRKLGLPSLLTPSIVDNLPRVRGLSNLGNTCFFNAVLQCLARTPFLTDLLKQNGEHFQLPGGPLKLTDDSEINVAPIGGPLDNFGQLTLALANTLSELQSGSGGVFTPRPLLKQLTDKWPQFDGGDQQDSHELLRHLLESVRNEDMRRYQRVVLVVMGYLKNSKDVNEQDKQKVKFYGEQIQNRILVPEPVFQGCFVSTLTCQECFHESCRHEYFLDLSIPVCTEKPHPQLHRRKASPDQTSAEVSADYTCRGAAKGDRDVPKPLTSTEKRKIKKARQAAKKASRQISLKVTPASGVGDSQLPENDEDTTGAAGGSDGVSASAQDGAESSADRDGMSDADVEDNLTDDAQPRRGGLLDQNGNQSAAGTAAGGPEKRDDAPENPNKEDTAVKNVVCELGISAEGVANMIGKMSLNPRDKESGGGDEIPELNKLKPRRQRTACRTLAPRYQCDENECSIQSCLNSFTVVEMMTGNNKVCCDNCTERINGKDGKSVYTNATKQFLISSPPAILIIHLKRFQVGPRGILRKITKAVTFPFVLDIAPFCVSGVEHLPKVRRGQKKLLYSLYGIVEHSGTMHGGHYVAYVKVRPELPKDDHRWTYLAKSAKSELDQQSEEALRMQHELAREKAHQMMTAARDSDDALTSTSSSSSSSASSPASSERSSEGEEEGAVGYSSKPTQQQQSELLPDVDPPPGKWYYVSDSHVREVSEDSVLSAQAYLLFYERIF
ncbi:ubiquitin carboxyl-terminal hydrolase 16 [Uranotaenia lowii]|uniref:ubiquitin carboxyl-terminal hydrolase 16 n=1 Tax=Uranotaenia lowii TaxID=190385 RepID=UPI0024787A01|nr:ubiquitin carboxyl-terminal hydrolase 16 [Uranotaenia lowii]